MKLPGNALISREKLTKYFLVSRKRDDKSRWLSRGGYALVNWQTLEKDLRNQILPMDATPTESTEYGQLYEIRGTLNGPNGVGLPVRSIWMTEKATQLTKLITIYPDKRKRLK